MRNGCKILNQTRRKYISYFLVKAITSSIVEAVTLLSASDLTAYKK